MNATSSELELAPLPEDRPAAILRGGARGLEIFVDGRAEADSIAAAVADRLAEAPGFFRGSDVRVRVEDGPLPSGCLGRLDLIAAQFELHIVEVGPPVKKLAKADIRRPPHEPVATDAVPHLHLAAGSAPAPTEVAAPAFTPDDLELFESAETTESLSLGALLSARLPTQDREAEPDELELDEAELVAEPEKTRVVLGPIRSGVILEHPGNLIVFGDVNPGAEVRAVGNIVVLGRLRGTAHAGIGRDDAFIMALRLEPQQLRIGRRVTRAGEGETPGSEPEIAHVIGETITVERYAGKLPRNLAAGI